MIPSRHPIAAFQGELGAYSEAALRRFLGGNISARSYSRFDEVFAAVQDGDADYGVLPIENSYAGSVVQVYDLFDRYDVSIVGEQYLKIEHNLLGLPQAQEADITDVYSHEQAFLQCQAYLDRHPTMRLHPYFNTAVSAKYIAETGDTSKAAIASEYAAQCYELKVLAPHINDSISNTTRFIVISKNEYNGTNADKASISFVLTHQPGVLAAVLQALAKNGLNMAKIESRPLPGRNFEYVFYVDFVGPDLGTVVKNSLEQNRELFLRYKLLGAYPAAPQEG